MHRLECTPMDQTHEADTVTEAVPRSTCEAVGQVMGTKHGKQAHCERPPAVGVSEAPGYQNHHSVLGKFMQSSLLFVLF